MNRYSKQGAIGFTLIELLVVIAIISILATIAVSNYRGASIRAKSSHAMAELKVIVGGLEGYRVDFGAYPTYHYAPPPNNYEFFIGGSVNTIGSSPAFDGRNPLTTPIRYITTFPEDPFAGGFKRFPERHQYHYVNLPYACWKVAPNDPRHIFYRLLVTYGAYRIHARGPDGYGPDTGTSYDPTNGLGSRGDIIYSPRTGFAKHHELPGGNPPP